MQRLFSFVNSIAGQMLFLLVLAVSIAIGSFYVTFRIAKDAPPAPPVMLFTERQIGTAELLTAISAKDRDGYVDYLRKEHPRIKYQLHHSSFVLPEGLEWKKRNPFGNFDGPPPPPDNKDFGPGPPREPHALGNPQKSAIHIARKIEQLQQDELRVSVFLLLEDGDVLSVQGNMRTARPPSVIVSLFGVFVGICVVLMLIWALFFLVRPLRSLAQITDRIASDREEPQKASISGPTELRVAASALNKMQDRIHDLIEDRTRMLAAVGHDLRTPVTRLRLRSEMIESEDIKSAMLRDLGLMDGLLSRLMTYFRKGETGEKSVTLELSSLIDSLVGEWSDAGHNVAIAQSVQLKVKARPNELMRMVENLIDNAIKYAGSCTLALFEEDGRVCLQVIDHGPGIPEAERKHLLEPFARGDKARTMDATSGFGLGLAIARQAVQNHNADMELSETPGGGLTVSIRFPAEAL